MHHGKGRAFAPCLFASCSVTPLAEKYATSVFAIVVSSLSFIMLLLCQIFSVESNQFFKTVVKLHLGAFYRIPHLKRISPTQTSICPPPLSA